VDGGYSEKARNETQTCRCADLLPVTRDAMIGRHHNGGRKTG